MPAITTTCRGSANADNHIDGFRNQLRYRWHIRFLDQLAHPDQGGTEGLAARVNAARDRLLKG